MTLLRFLTPFCLFLFLSAASIDDLTLNLFPVHQSGSRTVSQENTPSFNDQSEPSTGWISTNHGGGGQFNHVAAGPSGILVAGSDLSGAYLSRNQGESWEHIGSTQGLDQSHVSSVGFDPVDSNIIYLGMGGVSGIYRSSDGGNFFTQVLGQGYIPAIQMAPSNPNIGYAVHHPNAFEMISTDIYRSQDRGLTWQAVSTGLPSTLSVLKLVVSSTDTNVVYLISGKSRFMTGAAQVYHSRDGGVTWQRLATSIPDDIYDLAIGSGTPQTLYLTTFRDQSSTSNPEFGATYVSQDQGATWDKIIGRAGVLWLDANQPSLIRLADPRFVYAPDRDDESLLHGIWQSTNNGQEWQLLSSVTNWEGNWYEFATAYATNLETEVKTVVPSLTNPDQLVWANAFIYGSFDGGQTVQQLTSKQTGLGSWQSRGVDNIVPKGLALSADPNKIYAMYDDTGCWRSLDRGQSWESCMRANFQGSWSAGGHFTSVIADPVRPDVVWASGIAEYRDKDDPRHRGFVAKSIYAGEVESWWNVSSGLPQTPDVVGLALSASSPINDRTLFVTADNDVYRSTDDGQSWTLVLDCNGCRSVTVDPQNGDLVYAGGFEGLWGSKSGGAPGTWIEIGRPVMTGRILGGANRTLRWTGIWELATDPNQVGWVYATVYNTRGENDGGLYRSSDFGTTWEKILDDGYLRDVAIMPGNSQVIYAASASQWFYNDYSADSRGVLRSLDGGQTWSQVNEGLAWPFANAIVFSPHDPADIWMAASGRGIHYRHFSDLPPTATPLPAATPTPFATATPQPVNLVRNGDFSQNEAFWIDHSTAQYSDGQLCFDPLPPSSSPSEFSISNIGLMLLQEGQRYEVKFNMWADQAVTVRLIVGEDRPPWANYFNTPLLLTPDRQNEHSFNFTVRGLTQNPSVLFFHLGGTPAQRICLDNIRLSILDSSVPTPVATPTATPTATPLPILPTLLENGDFSQGQAAWNIWSFDNGVQSDTGTGILCLTGAFPSGTGDGNVAQKNLPLIQGQSYQLQFDMLADKATAIHFGVGEREPPYTPYLDKWVTLPANSWDTYRYTFVKDNSDDPQATLFFHLGGHDASRLCLDNIILAPLITPFFPTATATATQWLKIFLPIMDR